MRTEGFNCAFNLETGSFIFAIFNAIVSSIGFVASVAFTVFKIYRQLYELNHPQERHTYGDALESGGMVMVSTAIGISVAFAVVLCIGICQRKAEYVMWYFVYGIVVIAIALASVLALAMFIIEFNKVDDGWFYSSVALCVFSVLFALILVMIRGTYKKFERELESNNYYGQLLGDKY